MLQERRRRLKPLALQPWPRETPTSMRELLILRHAKSSWDDPARADHERDLAPRGRKAARRLGRLLRDQGLVPDLALCSTALRTRRTLELLSQELPRPLPASFLRTLYLAPPSRLLAIIARQGEEPARLMVIGHNPGLHGLALQLAAEGDPQDLRRLREKLPTAALVQLALPCDTWRDIAAGAGRLQGFWRPRELADLGG